MKNKKILGGSLVAAAFLCVLAWGGYNALQLAGLRSETDGGADSSAISRYEETIDVLTEENRQLREQNEGLTENDADTVLDQAGYFIKQFYNNDSSTVSGQPERLKPLMTEELYNSMFEDVASSPGEYEGAKFQTYVDNIKAFYSAADAAKANVLILCTLNTMTDETEGLNRAQLIFQAEFEFINDSWLVSEIIQNQTFRYN